MPNAEQDQISLIQQQLGQWQYADFDLDGVVDRLHILAENYADAELQGRADGLVLLADQLNFQEDLTDQTISAANQLLNWYRAEISDNNFPIAALQAACWDEPLADEEAEPLLQLVAIEAPSTENSADLKSSGFAESIAQEEIDEPAEFASTTTPEDQGDTDTEAEFSSPLTVESEVPSTGSESRESIETETETESTQIERMGADSEWQWIRDLAGQFAAHDTQETDWLDEPIERLSEAGFEGLSDLLALYVGQVAEAEDEEIPTAYCLLLADAIEEFLTRPTPNFLESLLNTLAAEYDQEDVEFIEPLLQADLDKLQPDRVEPDTTEDEPTEQELLAAFTGKAAEVTTDHEPVEPAASDDTETEAFLPEQPIADEHEEMDHVVAAESQGAELSDDDELPSITIDINKPDFVKVDLNLLGETPASVDLDVVAMLGQTLQDLAQSWSDLEQWPTEGLVTTSMMQLAAMGRALETVGLTGARFVVEGVSKNIDWSAAASTEVQQNEQPLIGQCLQALVNYLAAMDDKLQRENLVDACSALACGPDLQQSAFLSGLLALATLKDPSAIERKVAADEDVSLVREKDVDDDLLSMLKNELPVLSDEFSLHLQNIVSEQQLQSLLEAQRAAHTIKGLANMAGIRGVANITHYLEDILELMTDSQLLPCEQVGDDMLDAADCLADMCEQVTSGSDQTPEQAIIALQKIFDWHYQAKTQGVEILADAAAAEQSDSTLAADSADVSAEASASNDTSDELNTVEPETTAAAFSQVVESALNSSQQGVNQGESSPNEEESQLSVPIGLLNNLFRLAGESTTLNTQLEEELASLRKMTRMSRERYRSLERVMADLEQHLHSLNHQPVLPDQRDESFDELEMDRYNELDSTLSRLQESAADVNEVTGSISRHAQQLQELQSQQSGLQKETLDTIIRTRMVPVATIASRVQRIVRQAARATGKKVKLKLEGEQVLIDSQILHQLVAPLMHMIRNAVDHGIETPHARFEVSKPETGEITLSFARNNDRLLIRCRDDGAGIDGQLVQQQALSKGLIDGEAELSETEAQRLILLPGFSTRDEISQLSGRGIGMDVVNLEIAKLHGTLNIQSELGKGTLFELSLPPSALTVRSLLIRCGQQILALSTQGVDQSIISIDGDYSDDRRRFTHDDEEYQVLSVESLMGKPTIDYAAKSVHPILLIKTGVDSPVALQIDEILAHRELIFKEMGDLIPMLPGISGLTILANGEVAPVVDIPSRVRFAQSGAQVIPEYLPMPEESGLPRIMVVDDSISARQSIVVLLEDLGYEVDSAIDGFDAMNKIRDKKPDLVLTDYEMPRVNGVELASTLRGHESTSDIPITMITSRSTAKHRQAAEEAGVDRYITKPWTETQLLQSLEELLQEKAEGLKLS